MSRGGALALPTMVAASLTGYSSLGMGSMSALTSSLVFPTVGLIALYVMGKEPLVRRYGIVAILLGGSLALFLYIFNRLGFVETAGLLAGGLVSILAFLCAALPGPHHTVGADVPVLPLPKMRILFPYLLVLLLLCVTRMIPPITNWLASLWVLSSGQVRFSVFLSPGVALMVTVLVMHLRQPESIKHAIIWRKIQMALASLFCFVLLGQIMSESNMIGAAAEALKVLKQEYGLLLLLSTLLGMLSGFVTGSNVGANALVMGVQQKIGVFAGDGLLFAGLQNSAAGHAVFASLPIIVLILTIVGDNVDEATDKSKLTERELLKFGLKVMTVIYAALLISIILALLTGQYVARPFA